MKKLLLGALCCASAFLPSTNGFAGDRAYVSKSGSGTACSQAVPCATFATAITVAGVDGEVVCLDSGFFGSFSITASVTINCENHIGQAGATLNSITLPANGVVVLNGIDIDQRNFGGNSITFDGAGTLIIRNSSIRNSTIGVRFIPNASAKLVIVKSIFDQSTDAGIRIEPAAAGTYQVDMDGVESTNNLGGVAIIANQGKTVNLEIRNSLLAQNTSYGLYSAGGGTGASNTLIDNSSVSNNGNGVVSTGATSIVRVSRSVLVRNNIGFLPASGGSILSYGNNAVNSTTAGGGPTGTVSFQ